MVSFAKKLNTKNIVRLFYVKAFEKASDHKKINIWVIRSNTFTMVQMVYYGLYLGPRCLYPASSTAKRLDLYFEHVESQKLPVNTFIDSQRHSEYSPISISFSNVTISNYCIYLYPWINFT